MFAASINKALEDSWRMTKKAVEDAARHPGLPERHSFTSVVMPELDDRIEDEANTTKAAPQDIPKQETEDIASTQKPLDTKAAKTQAEQAETDTPVKRETATASKESKPEPEAETGKETTTSPASKEKGPSLSERAEIENGLQPTERDQVGAGQLKVNGKDAHEDMPEPSGEKAPKQSPHKDTTEDVAEVKAVKPSGTQQRIPETPKPQDKAAETLGEQKKAAKTPEDQDKGPETPEDQEKAAQSPEIQDKHEKTLETQKEQAGRTEADRTSQQDSEPKASEGKETSLEGKVDRPDESSAVAASGTPASEDPANNTLAEDEEVLPEGEDELLGQNVTSPEPMKSEDSDVKPEIAKSASDSAAISQAAAPSRKQDLAPPSVQV